MDEIRTKIVILMLATLVRLREVRSTASDKPNSPSRVDVAPGIRFPGFGAPKAGRGDPAAGFAGLGSAREARGDPAAAWDARVRGGR